MHFFAFGYHVVKSALTIDQDSLTVVLADFDKQAGKRVTLKININPTVRVVWIAIVLMCLGGLIALFDVRRGNQSKDVIAGQWQLRK